ncbi:MAG: 2-C-methyl-D-erythritol 4-phosphate cytidylyltransferase [Porticoccaceae bacterium]|nr:2-C-methyl-D-erythritol 4-phosphate cytidylyltransferase [Porticoccaceae bacterium]
MQPQVRHSDLSVLIPAAGSGERLGLGSKALLELSGQPLIAWLSRKLLNLAGEVIIATPSDQVEHFSALCPGARCIQGGQTRQQSVNALVASASRDWVLVADVARPFASLNLYNAVLARARKTGVAGAFLPPDVPVAEIVNGKIARVLKSQQAGVFQLPHGFSRKLLVGVLAEAEKQGWEEQSTLELAIRAGYDVGVVAGEKTNIKLTTKEDWLLASSLTEYLL